MRAAGLLGAALLLWPSCGAPSRNHEPPDTVLGRDDFIEVMAEVQLIEAAMKQRMLIGDDGASRARAAYLDLFERHEITGQLFEESHAHWFGQPEAMVEIMQEVTERLTAWEREIEGGTAVGSSAPSPK